MINFAGVFFGTINGFYIFEVFLEKYEFRSLLYIGYNKYSKVLRINLFFYEHDFEF